MSIETKIAELLAQAEPLRSLEPLDAEAAGLPEIVRRINDLRELQSKGRELLDEAIQEGHEAEFAAVAESVNRPAESFAFYNPISNPGGLAAKEETDRQEAAFQAERVAARRGRPRKNP